MYPLTENQPKPLLKVADRPIIEHTVEKLAAVPEITETIIVTNSRFYSSFEAWLQVYSSPSPPKITLLNDGTFSNETRLGAVGDIHFALNSTALNDHLLVIAGDNLFGFALSEFINMFNREQKTLVAFYDFQDRGKLKKRYGVGVLDGNTVINFEEKPEQPKSSLAATCCYLISQDDLPQVQRALEEGKADRPGDFIRFLVNTSEVHAFVFTEHWFDIGSFESLKEAEEYYRKL